jgi:hypothetical protein
MDADRFDDFLRALSAPRRRRSLFHLVTGLVLGGLASTAWLSESEAKKKRKGKKKRRKKNPPQSPPPPPTQCPATCPECQQCVNNQSCTPVNGGVCQNNACKVCQGGSCVNNNGITCGNSLCKECRDGQCVNKQNGTSCNNEGQCVNGACIDPPNCKGRGATCSAGTECCSQDCPTGTCAQSAEGEQCRTSRDCNPNDIAFLNFCNTSFVCQEPVVGGG